MSAFADVSLLISAKSKDLGGGFIVRRSLPNPVQRMVGPFIFFDHMGPVDLEIGHGMDVRPHPHIGLSTLTYLFEGEIVHKDTLGVEQVISPGAVNWMTAGSGIAHSERSSRLARQRPQKIHGLQIWIALPKEHEEVTAAFDHYTQKDIPEIHVAETKVRVVAGEFEAQKSPVATHSNLLYLDLEMYPGKPLIIPHENRELAVYIVEGHANVGSKTLSSGDMAILEKGKPIHIEPLAAARVMVLGGEPFPEARYIWWNFVSTSQERIEKAKLDWQNNNFGKIRGETEFIPLPTS